ncbi:hypothetical protein R3W88_032672 [Solanum pinnatisectum]|uniref:Uncharacterized protein n=1 Tax=Solanum pinnatisectum TaxID=50273 RepID=A0AAV9LSI3_9SOLN|nr:hypothetical protein R3W88_032672 [Solanum pinnatisectum]
MLSPWTLVVVSLLAIFIPTASSLFQLHHLHTLNLAYNDFNPSLTPHNIGRLKNLRHLNLSDAYFLGKIPTEISYLSNLVSLVPSYLLSLFNVNISSPIPVNISSSLRYLDLRYTNLRGVLTESFFLPPNSLETLKLSDNDLLKGVFPKIHRSNTLLMDISFTGISGELPHSVGTFSSLNILNLHDCQFSGSIPDSIGNLTQITELDLSVNHFTGHIPSTISHTFTSLVQLLFSGLPDDIKTNPTLEYLYLSNNQLSGSFPQSLANLTNLSTLDLSTNNITSDAAINITFPRLQLLQLSSCELKDFPYFLRNVKTLEVLDMSKNKICGQIPNWFSGMRWDSLEFLNLSHNSLTGHLPQFHYRSLEHLDLKFNSLQGPLISSICNMSWLTLLDLSHNYFTDSVPYCLGFIVSLDVLDLIRNNFTGSLPPFCALSDSLRTVVLNGNRFEGPVPMSLLNCDDLEILDVGNNAINGTFPAWLGTLPELQVLIVNSNKFHGPISTRKKFYFPRLRRFDLSQNEFSGSLPAEVFRNFKAMIKLDDREEGEIEYMGQNMNGDQIYEDSVRLMIKGNNIELERISTIMTTIDLSSNHFEGVIPKTLKDLSSLWLLNLSHNNLIGHIPMELGRLNTLESLDLSWNRLTGKIPQELTRMNFLAFLNLSQNHLIRPIPHGPQFNTFENDSYGGNLDLCGPPLSK